MAPPAGIPQTAPTLLLNTIHLPARFFIHNPRPCSSSKSRLLSCPCLTGGGSAQKATVAISSLPMLDTRRKFLCSCPSTSSRDQAAAEHAMPYMRSLAASQLPFFHIPSYESNPHSLISCTVRCTGLGNFRRHRELNLRAI